MFGSLQRGGRERTSAVQAPLFDRSASGYGGVEAAGERDGKPGLKVALPSDVPAVKLRMGAKRRITVWAMW